MNARAYETYDLTLAAFLVATDSARLTDITGNGGGRKRFVFNPPPSKAALIRFYSGEAEVSARRFAEAWSRALGLPTRSEVDAIGERLHRLQRRIVALELGRARHGKRRQ